MERLGCSRRLWAATLLVVITSLAAAQPPGSGIGHLRARREARRYVLDGRKYYGDSYYAYKSSVVEPYASDYKCVPTQVVSTGYATTQENVATATSFTSDRPKLTVVATMPTEYLYYDLTNETYWVIGEQFVRGLDRNKAADYIARNPVDIIDNTHLPVADRKIAAADETAAASSWAEPLANSGSAADSVLKRIADSIPATVKQVDKTKQAGWADYDGDGVVDEYFPHEQTVVNPELIKVLKQLDAVESSGGGSQE